MAMSSKVSARGTLPTIVLLEMISSSPRTYVGAIQHGGYKKNGAAHVVWPSPTKHLLVLFFCNIESTAFYSPQAGVLFFLEHCDDVTSDPR